MSLTNFRQFMRITLMTSLMRLIYRYVPMTSRNAGVLLRIIKPIRRIKITPEMEFE